MAEASGQEVQTPPAWAMVATVALLLAQAPPGCYTAQLPGASHRRVRKLFGSNFNDPMAEEKLQKAEDLFAAKDYEKSLKEFRTLADNQGTPPFSRNARFMQCRLPLHARLGTRKPPTPTTKCCSTSTGRVST